MAVEKAINNGFGAYKSGEASVKPSYGVERIPFNGLVGADPTAGPEAFNLSSGDPRFVFTNGVGRWFYSSQDDNTGNGNFNASIVTIGTFIGTTGVTNQTVTGTLTINFFGTDLNLLIADALVGGAGNSWSIAPVVNGTAGTTITRASGQNSPVLSNVSNVRGNQVLPLGLNLTAGNHTVVLTISLNPASGQAVGAVLPLYGCEIVTEKAADNTTLTDISNGDIFSDGYRYRFTDTTPARPPVIPTAYSGSRGARVISYINPLTQIFEQAIQNVDATQANFAAADHTNEEIVRRINFREFGANSEFTDAIANTDAAFTLDDGTTTLVGNDIQTTGVVYPGGLGQDVISIASAADFLTLTFVGTGLDVFASRDVTALANGVDVIAAVDVDGLTIGTSPNLSLTGPQILPIVSGLAYGTHTVRIRSSAGQNIGIVDFIIYGPKKPTIPASSVEIADYNIMAEYNDASVTDATNLGSVSTGVLRKPCLREFIYNGSVILIALSNSVPGSATGQALNVTTGAGLSYTFYGTGIELIAANNGDTVSRNFTISVDGTALGTRFTTTTLPTGRYTSGTSRWDTQSSDATTPQANRLKIEGMPLGVHTVVANQADNGIAFVGADIITPVHYQNPNLKVGSVSIGDVRPDFANIAAENPVVSNLGEAKAWINFRRRDASNATSNTVLSSHNVAAVVSGIGISGFDVARFTVYFDKPFKDNTYVTATSIEGDSSTAGVNISTNITTNGSIGKLASGFSGILSNESVADQVCITCFGELIDE